MNISLVLNAMREDVRLMEKMWKDPHVQMYQDLDLPAGSFLERHGAIFLLGPTSRNQLIEFNWRKEAVSELRNFGYRGWIYVPENRGGYGRNWGKGLPEEFDAPEWETSRWLDQHTVATLSWIPRDEHELLGLNTNWEEGFQCGAVEYGASLEKIFIGWPDHALRMKLPRHYLKRMEKRGWDPETKFSNSLIGLCEKVCVYLGLFPSDNISETLPI